MNIYQSLVCRKDNTAETWMGNDRWFVKISPSKHSYKFCAAPVSRACGDLINGKNVLNKTFFELQTDISSDEHTYGADFFENEGMRLVLPFHEYGAVIDSTVPLNISINNHACVSFTKQNNTVCITDGVYSITFVTNGIVSLSEKSFTITNLDDTKCHTAVAYGVHQDIVFNTSLRLFDESDITQSQSRKFWEGYFESCPVSRNNESVSDSRKLLLRQYWAWWCLLVNVSDIEFNDFPVYMSPEKTGWLGTWSNDGPECMAALSLTNQKDLARRIICSYIDAAIDDNGRYAWYLHADGERCYGRTGDPGRLSNGAACIVHTVGFYIRNTGDKEILNQVLPSGKTVYDKLKNYISVVQRDRDINGDALIDWSNLWESGWDDKLGCFFEKAPISEWWSAIENSSAEEFEEFCEKNRCPVTTIVEQVYLLWGLSEMAGMAELQQDGTFAKICLDKYDRIIQTVEESCWSESDSFYHDLNVNCNSKIPAKSTDAFYFLYFAKQPQRCEKMYGHLLNQQEFNLMYIPMQSADCDGFSPNGYWSGGHWPREMAYLSLGLHNAGFCEKAREIVCKAINCGDGNTFYEVLNPFTGKPTTGVTHMAYDVLNVVALLTIDGQIKWTD